MKKVLILSYFFPPCNLTASQRAFGWAKYFKKFGYYPVIITRNWDIPIGTPLDVLKESGKEVRHEVNDMYEIYYLPYRPSFRDRFFVKYGESGFGFIRRVLTFFEIFFESISNRFTSFSNLYAFADDYIKKDKTVERIVVTANPFTMFRFGYLLHKKYNIKWLADYRDDWNTSDFRKKNIVFERLLNRIRSRSEKRWVGTAEAITTVSERYKNKISNFVGKDGHVLLNGYFAEEYNLPASPLNDEFTIVYNGSLYPTQEIEIFLDAFKKLVDKLGKDKARLKIIFPGLQFDTIQANRVITYLKGYEQFFEVMPRIPKMEVFKLQAKAHLFLMVAHKGLKGIPSSKLYEYIGFGKPIIACPTDGDIIEQTLVGYNIAAICPDTNSAYQKLEELYTLFEDGHYHTLIPNKEYQQQFIREHSTAMLADILDKFYLPESSGSYKKVLILAHDFPPYTSIGALRPYSWYKYLKDYDLYPVVITRQWDNPKDTAVDVVRPSTKQFITTEYSDSGTLIRVPYKSNLRDKLIIRYGLKRYNLLRRFLTFYYSIGKFIWRSADNTDIIFRQAEKLIRDNKIDCIIATGEPFVLFQYANKLSKKTGIKWIADYRDGWTTNLTILPKSLPEKAVNMINGYFERKYISNAALITKAAKTHAEVFLQKYPKSNVKIVLNGYNDLDESIYNSINQTNDVFTITYSGTIYGFQRVDIFLEGFKKFIENTGARNCRVVFLGLDFYPEQHNYVFSLYPEINSYLVTTKRISNQDVLKELLKSNVLLLLSDVDSKTLPAKIFEYLYVNRKIYLVRDDKGILNKYITETNAGVGLNDAEEVCSQLTKDYDEFSKTGKVANNTTDVAKFSRKNQAQRLAELIKGL